MTTTFLNISNMKGNRSIDEVETTLDEAGFHPVLVFSGRAKIAGSALSYKDIVLIKRSLKQRGFNLLSLSEITNKGN